MCYYTMRYYTFTNRECTHSGVHFRDGEVACKLPPDEWNSDDIGICLVRHDQWKDWVASRPDLYYCWDVERVPGYDLVQCRTVVKCERVRVSNCRPIADMNGPVPK